MLPDHLCNILVWIAHKYKDLQEPNVPHGAEKPEDDCLRLSFYYYDKNNWVRKCAPSSREVSEGTRGRNMEAGTEEGSWLVPPGLLSPDHLPGGGGCGTTQHEMGLPT